MAAVVPGRAVGLTYSRERAPLSTQSAFAALQSPHGTPSPCFCATPTLHLVPPLYLPPAAAAATPPWGLQPGAVAPAPALQAVGKRASLPASLGDAAAVFSSLPRRAPTAPLATGSVEVVDEGDVPAKAQSAMELGTGAFLEQGYAQPLTPAGGAVAARLTARRTSAPALLAAPWPPPSPAARAPAPLASPAATAHGRCVAAAAAAAPIAMAGGCAVRTGGPASAAFTQQPLTLVAAPACGVAARPAPAALTAVQSPRGMVLVASPMLAPASPSWSFVAPKVRRKPREAGPSAAAPPAPAPQWATTDEDEESWPGGGDCAELHEQKELFTKGWTREAKQSHSAKSVRKVDGQAEKRRQQSARDKAKNMGLTLDDVEE
ncbi:unnamed protein product [Prorocentrum cordatum]|uniref:Uncharacterized protein n=1 Tax=Prorocentrum cordatum TaxID=2364126 RepID=A0ABN9WRN7_9DINO|nr:unnamed protein product [Polarella glacialis]